MKKIINRLLDAKGSKKVLIIGDVMLDEYEFGSVDRISPEAPVPVLKKQREESCLGGAANVAANCKQIGLQVSIIGLVNENDQSSKKIVKLLQDLEINTQGIVYSSSRVTTCKRRIMTGTQQCVRVDSEDGTLLTEEERHNIIKRFDELYTPETVVLISDYAKGVVEKELVAHIVKKANVHGNMTIADPKGPHFDKYRGVRYVKPNLSEYREMAASFGLSLNDSMLDNGRVICESLGIEALIVTMGEKGMRFVSCEKDIFSPAYKQEVYDLSGAGDTVFAFFALSIAHNLSIEDMLRLANKAASVAVSHLKTYAVRLDELLNNDHDSAKKIFDNWARLKIELDWLRLEGKRIVFTNGCFDLLHSGHVYILHEAKKLGDVLIVGLNADESVRMLNKGLDRPINDLAERSTVMSALGAVDFVTSFTQATPKEIIEYLQPDVLVKGGDYKREEIVGYDYMMRTGGEVHIVDLVPGRSTTRIVSKFKKDKTDGTKHTATAQ